MTRPSRKKTDSPLERTLKDASSRNSQKEDELSLSDVGKLNDLAKNILSRKRSSEGLGEKEDTHSVADSKGSLHEKSSVGSGSGKKIWKQKGSIWQKMSFDSKKSAE